MKNSNDRTALKPIVKLVRLEDQDQLKYEQSHSRPDSADEDETQTSTRTEENPVLIPVVRLVRFEDQTRLESELSNPCLECVEDLKTSTIKKERELDCPEYENDTSTEEDGDEDEEPVGHWGRARWFVKSAEEYWANLRFLLFEDDDNQESDLEHPVEDDENIIFVDGPEQKEKCANNAATAECDQNDGKEKDISISSNRCALYYPKEKIE